MNESPEEEEKESPPAAAVPDELVWTDNLHSIAESVPPRHPPVQHAATPEATPLQLLQLYLPPPLIQQFAEYTNNTAPHGWRHTTVAELYAFIGVHIYMGIDRLPETEMYWSATFGHPYIMQLFSRDRFKQLLRFFAVSSRPEENDVRDPLPYVRSLIANLNTSFAIHYDAGHYLCIDESMAAYKGRATIKQFIPSKPHKWGYKIYCLCSDNYLLRFEVYEGAQAGSAYGSTHDLVMRLVAGYGNKDRILFTDQFFTSPALMAALKAIGIRLCGSANRRRRGMPSIPAAGIDSLHEGQWIQRQKGDAVASVWQSRRQVWLLYNHCSPCKTAAMECWSKAGNKYTVGCPQAYKDYFIHARSVDILNQLHYGYLIGRKAQRCWPRLAWWLIDACILNAYTLWSTVQHSSKHLDFRIQLMHQLAELLPADQRPRAGGAAYPAATALAKDHYSIITSEERDCHQPLNRRRTNYICSACNVHLCLGDCFRIYHTSV